jgi:hypothetical protein
MGNSQSVTLGILLEKTRRSGRKPSHITFTIRKANCVMEINVYSVNPAIRFFRSGLMWLGLLNHEEDAVQKIATLPIRHPCPPRSATAKLRSTLFKTKHGRLQYVRRP